jgi:hypothetical protein
LPQRTDYLLVPRGAAILEPLRQSPRWQELYADDQAVLLVRADEAHADVLQRSRSGQLVPPEVPTAPLFK